MLTEPAINTSVTLDIAGWATPLWTRVEDLDETVIVADPLVRADDHEPALGSPVTMTWKGPRGPAEMPATLIGKELRKLLLWRLQPEGPVVITQRRHHARAGTLLPTGLRTDAGRIAGHVVDLSEGGVRAACTLSDHVSVGDRLGVDFAIADRELVIASEVVRVELDDERAYVGCRFLAVTPWQADLIRKFVFDRQVRERRLRYGR